MYIQINVDYNPSSLDFLPVSMVYSLLCHRSRLCHRLSASSEVKCDVEHDVERVERQPGDTLSLRACFIYLQGLLYTASNLFIDYPYIGFSHRNVQMICYGEILVSERNLILALAKVLIAAAWADHDLTPDERDSLQDLLFRLPESYQTGNRRLNSQEWTMLEMYLDSPVGEEERALLVHELQEAIRTSDDQELALQALDDLIRADGAISPQEEAMREQVRAALEEADVGLLGYLTGLLRGPMDRRSQAVEDAPNRARYFDDFIRNRVYYAVRQQMDEDDAELYLPDETLRRLSAIGGLMARVAHVDQQVTDAEFDTMVELLQSALEISQNEALFVAQVAIDEVTPSMDFLRLTRELSGTLTPEEGGKVLDLLFAVADADGYVSHEEIEQIYTISYNLNLAHGDFITAKMKIPGERRES